MRLPAFEAIIGIYHFPSLYTRLTSIFLATPAQEKRRVRGFFDILYPNCMEIVHAFFEQNEPLIQFAYGLVFFVMGVAIALQSRYSSRLELARSLRWLAAFGFTHGLYVWGELFAPVQASFLYPLFMQGLHFLHLLALIGSYVCLFEFGMALLRPLRYGHGLRLLVGGWHVLFTLLMVSVALTNRFELKIFHDHVEALAGYMIAFPGGLFAAYGLREQTYRLIAPLDAPNVVQMLRTAGITLALFGVLRGLIPPPIQFFPGTWLNQQSFEMFVGVPLLIFLFALGGILLFSMVRALEIFYMEMERTIEHMEQQQILLAERERIARELHDNTLQMAYTAGLLIDSARKLAEPESPIAARLERAVMALNEVIAELRRNMQDLHATQGEEDARRAIRTLVNDPRFRTLVEIQLKDHLPEDWTISPRQTMHLLSILQEALSNVVRHAKASRVVIDLRQDEQGQTLLEIYDDGIGISSPIREGYGIRNMHERARMMGGRLTLLNCTPEKGTRVLLSFPAENPSMIVERAKL